MGKYSSGQASLRHLSEMCRRQMESLGLNVGIWARDTSEKSSEF